MTTLVKLILTPADLRSFLDSAHFRNLFTFLRQLNDSCIGRIYSLSPHDQQQQLGPVLDLIDQCERALELFPRLSRQCGQEGEHVMNERFGNRAFREYARYIGSHLDTWTSPTSCTALNAQQQQPDQPEGNSWSKCHVLIKKEALAYFAHAFGNPHRIDYGTGHELSFLIFLYILTRAHFLPLCADLISIVLKRYLEWMRRVQSTYWLEPAGSHGVWGLDDYQFAPFLFGAAQLRHHPYLRPKSIHCVDILLEYASEYLYFWQVRHVNEVKMTASLAWHSPLLNDISGAKGWDKVNEGLMRMYRADVLEKLPIMQHVMFGRFLGAVGMSAGMWTEEEMSVWRGVLEGGDGVYECVQEFVPPSARDQRAHYSILFPDDHEEEPQQSNVFESTTHTNQEQQEQEGKEEGKEEEEAEVVVKYVIGPSGKRVPIMGKIAASHVPQIQHESHCQFRGGDNQTGLPVLITSNPIDAPTKDVGSGGGVIEAGREVSEDVVGMKSGKVAVQGTYAMGQERPVCCGIRVPSAIAAKMYEEERRLRGAMPFD